MLTCEWKRICREGGKTWGLQKFGECHSLDFGAIEHESLHFVFNYSVGENTGHFLAEGVVMYFQKQSNYELAYSFPADTLKKLILEQIDFFSTKNSYPVSGVFVNFLIEKWGLEKFKTLYIYKNISNGFKTIYNKTIDEIIIDFKEWNKAQLPTI
ncbi:MAG: hypothetical protein JXB00_17470 [Bacteroidales bacterium]|nr:hypothetical protein [Bacteroidales bacterium]